MIKKFLTLGTASALAFSGALSAQETTVDITQWAYAPGYVGGPLTGADTNSPTFTLAGANYALAAKFQPIDMSFDEAFMEIKFTMTVDEGGFGSGNLRIGVYNENGLLGSPAGDPLTWNGAGSGFTGYVWSIASAGNAPGSGDGGAGTGTIVGRTAANASNWVSTLGGAYSLTPEIVMGPETNAPGGTYDVVIELFRLSSTQLEVSMTILKDDGAWIWSDTFRVDSRAVATEGTTFNYLGIAQLTTEGTASFALSGAQVTGTPSDTVEPPPPAQYLGTWDITDNWSNTGAWLGWLYVASAPWVYSHSLSGFVYVAEDTFDASAGAWMYRPAP